MTTVIDWLKRWWCVPLALGAAVVLAVRAQDKVRRAANRTAIVELDRERHVAAEEAQAHRIEAEAAKREAHQAVAAMQTVAQKLRDADHDQLAAMVDAWY